MNQSITHTGAAEARPEEIRQLFEAERRATAESVAARLGQLEGLLLAALADGEDREIHAAIRMAGEAISALMPSLWRYGAR